MAKVLIVDDEESIRFSFSSILKDEGYEVISAEHPIDVHSIMNSNKFDVAVIDRLLVAESGISIVEFINKEQPCCTNILMSAYPNFKSAAEGLKHNLFAYLQKPVNKNELCSIVGKASVRSLEKQQKKIYDLELIRLQRMSTMGLLSKGIIHDYNNLLMPVIGLAQLACYELPPENDLTGELKTLMSATKQVRDLSQLLMSFSHSDDNTFEITNVKTLFEDSLALLRTIISKSIIIEEKIIGGDCLIDVNAAQIQQVVVNLGMNVMSAMEENKSLLKFIVGIVKPDISIQEKMDCKNMDCIKFSIENQSYEGKEDFPVKAPTLYFPPGQYLEETDIGLRVSYDIIKNHGGVIVVQNLYRPGERFDVYLPLAENKKCLKSNTN